VKLWWESFVEGKKKEEWRKRKPISPVLSSSTRIKIGWLERKFLRLNINQFESNGINFKETDSDKHLLAFADWKWITLYAKNNKNNNNKHIY